MNGPEAKNCNSLDLVYDTIRVAGRAQGASNYKAPGWSYHITQTDTGAVESIARRKLSTGVLEVLGDKVYIEGSMPKVWFGTNTQGVTSGEVREALGFLVDEASMYVDWADDALRLRRADIVTDFVVGDRKDSVLQVLGAEGARSRRATKTLAHDDTTGGRTIWAHAGGGGGRLYDKDRESGVELGGVIRFEAQERHRVRNEPLAMLDNVAYAANEDRWERCGYGVPVIPADLWFRRARTVSGATEGMLLQAYGYAQLSNLGRRGVEKSRRSRLETILRVSGMPSDTAAEPWRLDLEQRQLIAA